MSSENDEELLVPLAASEPKITPEQKECIEVGHFNIFVLKNVVNFDQKLILFKAIFVANR